MTRAVRQLVGGAIGVAAVVLPAWAIFHLIRQGSCGSAGQPTCPGEVGLWIMALVCSFVILAPVAIFVAGTDRATGQMLLGGPILVLAPLAFMAGIVVSLVGQSADPDSQWIGWVLGGLVVLILIRVIIGVGRRLRRSPRIPNLTAHPVDAAQMQQLATVLQQAQTSRAPAPKAPAAATKGKPDPALAARLRKLDELHNAGVIDDAEHRRRRDEILAEI